MVPFAILMTQREIAWIPGLGKWNRWIGSILLTVLLLGVASSLSRGPIVTLILTGGLALAWHYRPAAWGLSMVVIVLAGLVASNWDGFLRLLESDANEHKRAAVLVVDDQQVVYTGTRNRLVNLQVYMPILIEGGPLGYGTISSTGFPPANLPGLPTDPKVRKRLGIVDNAFLNNGLRFGWVGLVLFSGLFIATAITAFQLSRRASTYFFPLDQRYFIAAATLALAFLFEIATVFWSYDYALWIIFGFGLLSGLASSLKRPNFCD